MWVNILILLFLSVPVAALLHLQHLAGSLKLDYPLVDKEFLKCESPIERKLYNALKMNGYYP